MQMNSRTMLEANMYRSIVVLAVIVFISLTSPVNCYYNETRFREIVLHDHSNDDAIKMTTVSNERQRVSSIKSVSRVPHCTAPDHLLIEHCQSPISH